MAHAHDRTLLAQLGFADRDKRDPLHDLACRYVAQRSSGTAIVRTIMRSRLKKMLDAEHVELGRVRCECRSEECRHGPSQNGYAAEFVGRMTGPGTGRVEAAAFEFALTKGSDKYRTTIGFLDARLQVACLVPVSGVVQHFEPRTEIEPRPEKEVLALRSSRKFNKSSVESNFVSEPFEGEYLISDRDVVVEVKIAPEGAATSLRQISLYREHLTVAYHRQQIDWLLVTAYPLSTGEVEMLRSQGVSHLKLGPRFDDFVAQERAAASAAGNEEL